MIKTLRGTKGNVWTLTKTGSSSCRMAPKALITKLVLKGKEMPRKVTKKIRKQKSKLR